MANLGRRGASQRYISAGIISEDIADKVAELSGGEKSSQRLLVMTERRLQHAASVKHQEKGTALSAVEYANISRVIANPALVVWDTEGGHNNLIYIDQTRTIKVVVDAPNKDSLKPSENVDAVINAYKVDYADLLKKIDKGLYKIVMGNK
mgnify:FL=1